MTSTVIAVADIPVLEHDAAMALADVEYGRLLDAVERLGPEDWHRPTECAGWDVKDMVAHLLGMMERLGDPEEAARQNAAVGRRLETSPQAPIDALTAVQVETHGQLGPAELVEALRAAAARALAGRRGTTTEKRAEPFDPGPPFAGRPWTLGYLLDVVHTRDPWMHRIDIARATRTDPVLTPEHDGRLVADIVADWARLHGRPFTLVIGGPAGGTFASGDGERYELDAIDFCRIVSGRGTGHGLLTQEVPF